TEAIARGGASGTILLMRAGEVPEESSTVDLIDKSGAVVLCDVTRESFNAALQNAIEEVAEEADVKFDARAIAAPRPRKGIGRKLGDRFSGDVPDFRLGVAEGERRAPRAGGGGRVGADLVEREVSAVEGGARYELASLFSEGKTLEAVSKLRDLVAQSRRE